MKNHKLTNYELFASIHTVEIRSRKRPVLDEIGENIVKVRYRTRRSTGKDVCCIVINPHNYYNDEIFEYSLFEDVMVELTKKMKLRKEDWQYSRVDVRLDCFEDNYQEYFKLNALLIDLLAIKYTVKNREATVSIGHRTRFKRGVYIKNQTFCVDYYDKGAECQHRFPCKARLEFRPMKLNGKSPTEVVKLLFNKLNKLDSFYEKCLIECNKGLYNNYLWKNEHQPLKGKNGILTPYIWENQDVVYNMKQLKKFCRMCGINNFEGRAKSIKRTCDIEIICQKEIKDYISMIVKSITQFMES